MPLSSTVKYGRSEADCQMHALVFGPLRAWSKFSDGQIEVPVNDRGLSTGKLVVKYSHPGRHAVHWQDCSLSKALGQPIPREFGIRACRLDPIEQLLPDIAGQVAGSDTRRAGAQD